MSARLEVPWWRDALDRTTLPDIVNDRLETAMDEQNKIAHQAGLRLAVYAKFSNDYGIIITDELGGESLKTILGYKEYLDMRDNFTEEDVRLCEALLGPHGLTVYRTLLIRRGIPFVSPSENIG